MQTIYNEVAEFFDDDVDNDDYYDDDYHDSNYESEDLTDDEPENKRLRMTNEDFL